MGASSLTKGTIQPHVKVITAGMTQMNLHDFSEFPLKTCVKAGNKMDPMKICVTAPPKFPAKTRTQKALAYESTKQTKHFTGRTPTTNQTVCSTCNLSSKHA
jgi:hypothetical protein